MNTIKACMAMGVLALTPAFAQTGSTQTCTAPATGVTTLSFERSLTLNNLLTTRSVANTLDPTLVGQITSGALEVREQFNYDPAAKTLTSSLFAMAPSAAFPTPLNSIPANQNISGYTVAVDTVYFSCTPFPSALLVGRVTSTGANNPFGTNLNGAPVAISFGYTTDNPPQINNVVAVIAGTVVGYSAAGNGTLALINPPVTPPPGSNGGGPVIDVQGGFDQITSSRMLTLNASGTKDPGGTQVSYMWSQPTPGSGVTGCEDPNEPCTLQAQIKDANTPTPTVLFGSGKGDYLLLLTATNASGGTTSQVIRIRYIGLI